MIAKHFSSSTELTPTSGNERVTAIIGGLSEEAASKKKISIFFLSPGQAGCETSFVEFPPTHITTITVPALLDQCGQTIVKTE